MAARVDQVPAFPTLLAIARESLDEGYADGYATGSFLNVDGVPRVTIEPSLFIRRNQILSNLFHSFLGTFGLGPADV
jgi:hypothetical protein